MKHLKKFSTLLLLLVTISMFATSCKKDDDEAGTNSGLVGTWVAQGYDSKDGGYWQEIFEFKSNGSGTYTWIYDGDRERGSFEWTATKSTITMTWDGESETFSYSLSSNGKALNWEWDEEETYYKQ